MKEFNAARVKDECVAWIRKWFEENGKGCNAVIGISGGKDSTVVAALCVEALGKERVIGVMMPNGVQSDFHEAKEVCDHLGIKQFTVNINSVTTEILDNLLPNAGIGDVTNQTRINLSPRIRMSILYAISQSNNGRVANTCNLSEEWVGYSTRYGDAAGDFSPLAHLTVTEVREIGRLLDIPRYLVDKIPSDGLTGKSDEDNLGFTYATLDKYIRTGVCEDEETCKLIDYKHKMNLFKLQLMPSFKWDEQ